MEQSIQTKGRNSSFIVDNHCFNFNFKHIFRTTNYFLNHSFVTFLSSFFFSLSFFFFFLLINRRKFQKSLCAPILFALFFPSFDARLSAHNLTIFLTHIIFISLLKYIRISVLCFLFA